MRTSPWRAATSPGQTGGADTGFVFELAGVTRTGDYTQDDCMFEFTDDQAVRMRHAWTAFRA